jgi:DNA helicase HerA-like ATPase
MMQTDQQGRGYINILAADKLMQSPKLYATFLLWMLAELYENLPEVGDLEKPKMVFFLTKPTCSSMMRRRLCCRRSSRSSD